MSTKAKLFRSLLLEPLERRSVFSADGIEVWHFSFESIEFEFDQFQPAQFPFSGTATSNGNLQNGNLQNGDLQNGDLQNRGHSNEHDGEHYGVIFTGRLSPHGHSRHRYLLDDDSMQPLSPEGEGSGHPNANSRPSTVDSGTSQTRTPSTQPLVPGVDSASEPKLPSQPPASTPTAFLRFLTDSNNSSRVSNQPNSISGNTAGGNSGADRPASFASQNSTAVPSLASTNGTSTLFNQANTNPSALSTGTATFDFTSRLGSATERASASGLRSQRVDDFQFSKPQAIEADSMLDKALIEQSAGVESLENLLSGLAENHRRRRMQNEIEANQLDLKNEQNWRPEQTAESVEIAFADGGMITLALNRDIALSELEDISEDARSENKAWIANVGIYRAFENGAVATEYVGLTNRNSPESASSSTSSAELPEAELTDGDGEVANSQLHPLLASTSAALGAVMFGLRRMRKQSPLMYTMRNR